MTPEQYVPLNREQRIGHLLQHLCAVGEVCGDDPAFVDWIHNLADFVADCTSDAVMDSSGIMRLIPAMRTFSKSELLAWRAAMSRREHLIAEYGSKPATTDKEFEDDIRTYLNEHNGVANYLEICEDVSGDNAEVEAALRRMLDANLVSSSGQYDLCESLIYLN